MLLIHQAGGVKVGEVVRYTLTYTPSNDRILPTPSHLHLKVRNTSAIPLRAAWVHGPYTLHVCAYPATFNPHHKVENPGADGVPEYEPMVKAGGSWTAKLLVPEAIRETGADLGRRSSRQSAQQTGSDGAPGSVTWIVEIASQILFSNSASVGFEVLIGRDERSLDLGFAAVASHGHGGPGNIKDLQSGKERKAARRRGHTQSDGVYSRAVKLVVEDTEVLWDKPPLPSWPEEADREGRKSTDSKRKSEEIKAKRRQRKRRNVHLVILTHGLHSNVGADMLFLKESIDAAAAQARLDRRKRKEGLSKSQQMDAEVTDFATKHTNGGGSSQADGETSTAPLSGGQDDLNNAPDESDDEEETIVRGFPGNAVRTENGIQYLGKRLAKYILRLTYPDQPFLPVKKKLSRKLTDTFSSEANKARRDGKAVHQGSSIHVPRESKKAEDLPYHFTSISFIGHSLGGLIQTYAIAYIHKHSPSFFQQIKPVNFVCMASPMLGLSNENPMYVKFALDFGLVGRTGQDLGLTWRPPTLASKGWNAVMGLGSGNQNGQDPNDKQPDPSAKPLLRILPTGPAHQVLRMFRNRTVYSNVVNDGIVPLRTSCLLFLDWRGLGKVDKARRENGLLGTMAGWGWAELTGANASSVTPNVRAEQPWNSDDDDSEQLREGTGEDVPLPAEDETAEDNKRSTNRVSYEDEENMDALAPRDSPNNSSSPGPPGPQDETKSSAMWTTVFNFFRPSPPEKKTPQVSKKTKKALRRGQTIHHSYEDSSENVSEDQDNRTTSNPIMSPPMSHLHTGQIQHKRPSATRGDSLTKNEVGEVIAPPKTSIFESAGDVLHPPLPSKKWITDPSTRARTIFHDRVYHPEDIPPPPAKRTNSRLGLSFSSMDSRSSLKSASSDRSLQTTDSTAAPESGGMKVEEKIARAYHRDLSWRKVLVRLEPDAHNNMIVRRIFANAYGWPVVQHLCDTHFADSHSARTRDEDEPARERAPPLDTPISPTTGERVAQQRATHLSPPRTRSETREARDELAHLSVPRAGAAGSFSSRPGTGPRDLARAESAVWDDAFFDTDDGDDSDAVDERNLVAKLLNPNPALPKTPEPALRRASTASASTASASLPDPASPSERVAFADGHRGLAPTSPGAASPTLSRGRAAAGAGPFQGVVADSPVAEPETLVTTSPTVADVGLRKSVEEQLGRSPGSSRKGTGSSTAAKAAVGGTESPD